MMGIRLSLKTVLRDCVFMLCGTLLGILLAQGFLTDNIQIKNVSHLTKRDHLCPVDETSTNQNYSEKIVTGKRVNTSSLQQLYIGIATTQKMLSTKTVAAINNTWGRNVPMLEFLSTYNVHTTEGVSVVNLNSIEDTQSPQEKVYRMLRYLYDYYINEYSWFMLTNENVYIHVHNLLQFLSEQDSTKNIYIGQLEKKTPTKPHNHHCMEGPGVIFSRSLLKYLVQCLGEYLQDGFEKEIPLYNEGLERCACSKFGAQYILINEVQFSEYEHMCREL